MLVCMLLGSLLSCFYHVLFHSLRVFARFNVESSQLWTTTGCGGMLTHSFLISIFTLSHLLYLSVSCPWDGRNCEIPLVSFFVCVKDWNIQPEITRKIEPATNEARSEISDIKWEGMTIKELRTLFFYVLGKIGATGNGKYDI